FTFNSKTLQFESYKTPLKWKIFRGLGIGGALSFGSFCLAIVFGQLFPSNAEKALMMELDQMKVRYAAVNKQMEKVNQTVDRVHEMDGDIRKIIFGSDPMDIGIWSGGTGGSDQYGKLNSFRNTGRLLVETTSKLDKLERQVKLQETSFKDLLKLASEREKYLASIPSIKPVRADQLNRNFNLMSGFGIRLHPIFKIRRMHEGLDFAASVGTHIQASGNGKVVNIERERGGYGNNIEIDHGYGYTTKYAHMSSIIVKVGQNVTKGELIGKVGNTGTSTAPHLHYEVRLHGKAINPINFCMDNLNPEEYMEMVRMSGEVNKSFD
ncbi:MAG: M23 family metallopeptidase, partial [Saprospiraceae bacterium]